MDAQANRRAPVDQVRITDSEGLQAVLRIVERHYGSVRKTARALGFADRTRLIRLLSGVTRKSMDFETYALIRTFLADHPIEEPDGTWMFDLLGRFEACVESGEFEFYRHQYQRWLDGELTRLEEPARHIFKELWADAAYRAAFEHHLRLATRKADLPREHQKRQWVALYRTVHPFAAHDATWGVERSWRDLDRNELRSYLRRALHNERVLLKREGDFQRMALRPPPDEFWANLAGVDQDQAGADEPHESGGLRDGAEQEADDPEAE